MVNSMEDELWIQYTYLGNSLVFMGDKSLLHNEYQDITLQRGLRLSVV